MISLTMIVKNEAQKLSRCLDSVSQVVDDMVIVDTGSTDNTSQVAASYGARVFHFPWQQNFSEARNFAIEQSLADWCLVLDADEYLLGESSNNKRQLHHFISTSKELVVGNLELVNVFLNEKQQESHSIELIPRVFLKKYKYFGAIHEQLPVHLLRKPVGIQVYHDGYLSQNKGKRNIPLLKKMLHSDPNNTYYLYQLGREYRNKKKFATAHQYYARCYPLLTKKESFYPNFVVDFIYNCIAYKTYDTGVKLILEGQEFLFDFSDFWFAAGLFSSHYAMQETRFFSMIDHCFLNCLKVGESKRYTHVAGTGSYLALFNLGIFYESQGLLNKAVDYYDKAKELNYLPAIERLRVLKGEISREKNW